MAEIIVIGAGISGLVAAHLLRRAGHDVVVFDQCAAPGGRMRSERFGGFLMEYGASSIVRPAPAAETLVTQLGLDREMVTRSAGARRRYLVRDGRMRDLPLQPYRFLLSDFFSLSGRARMLMEPFIAAHHDDETVANFMRRRFGKELLEYVVDPLVGGLFAGDPAQLSVSAVFPQLKRLERHTGSVIGGIIKSRLHHAVERTGGPERRALSSFREGLGTLPRALTRLLPGRVLLGHRVEAVQHRTTGYQVRIRRGTDVLWRCADSVIVALPAYAAAAILDPLEPRMAAALAGISHPPLAVAFLGYRAQSIAHPLDGVGALMPAIEGRGVLGVLFSSTLFPGRAPPDHVALTAFIGGARQPQLALLAPRELEELACSEVRQLLGARAAPLIVRTHRWHYGLPQPGLGHARRLREIAAGAPQHPGLFLTGNYFSGVSAAACVQEAFHAAQLAIQHLARPEVRRRAVA